MLGPQMGRNESGELRAQDDPDAGGNDNQKEEHVGYGFVIFRGEQKITAGHGQLDGAEVFDAEVEGARHALRTAIAVARTYPTKPKITVCLDNVAAIQGLRGTPSYSSQEAFLDSRRWRGNTGTLP